MTHALMRWAIILVLALQHSRQHSRARGMGWLRTLTPTLMSWAGEAPRVYARGGQIKFNGAEAQVPAYCIGEDLLRFMAGTDIDIYVACAGGNEIARWLDVNNINALHEPCDNCRRGITCAATTNHFMVPAGTDAKSVNQRWMLEAVANFTCEYCCYFDWWY